MLSHVLHEIDRRRRFLVTAHARPDGDAIGSLLACGAILRQLGKHVDLILADRIPLIYETLPGARTVHCAPSVDGDYDAAILLECDGTPRTRLTGLDGRLRCRMAQQGRQVFGGCRVRRVRARSAAIHPA